MDEEPVVQIMVSECQFFRAKIIEKKNANTFRNKVTKVNLQLFSGVVSAQVWRA